VPFIDATDEVREIRAADSKRLHAAAEARPDPLRRNVGLPGPRMASTEELDPSLPAEASDDALRTLTRAEGAELIVRNRALHRLRVESRDGREPRRRWRRSRRTGAGDRFRRRVGQRLAGGEPVQRGRKRSCGAGSTEGCPSRACAAGGRRHDIGVYDNQRAVQDGATVPSYHESRLAKLAPDGAERPKIDPGFEEATEGGEVERKEKLRTQWAQLEAVVGADKRLALVARDIVEHFEQRLEAIDGKAMVVCMSRRVCVELYSEIVKLHPQWDSADDKQGALKLVMTGSAADPADWQPHIRNKPRREVLAHRFRDPRDPFKIVIVRDMWLTGFDAPSLHTMYVDKPMRGHGLMQAIARVNRVIRDKPGGLVVDCLGPAQELKAALATCTASGGTGRTALDQDEAVAVMLEKYEDCAGLFDGFDRAKWTTGTPQKRLALLPAAQEHALAQERGRTVRANVTIDWTLRENVRAQLRVLVKRILRKYGYPPDKQEMATQTVLQQAALLSAPWATA
jgi:type I site-specific restriction-modification system R (restriction) subunit